MRRDDSNEQEARASEKSGFSPVVKADMNKQTYTPDRNARDADHKKSYRRSLRTASPLTKLQLALTGVIAAATVLYCIFSGWQLYVIRAGGEETRKLADAAGDSAAAAKKQANASSEQVSAMRGQLDAMQDQSKSLQSQASTLKSSLDETRKAADAAVQQAKISQVSASIAERGLSAASESFYTGERAYIGLKDMKMTALTAGQTPTLTVVFLNGGRTPAWGFSSQVQLFWGPVRPRAFTRKSAGPSSEGFIPAGVARTVVFGSLGVRLSEMDITQIKGGITKLWVLGEAVYKDIRGDQVFSFCALYDPSDGGFSDCEK